MLGFLIVLGAIVFLAAGALVGYFFGQQHMVRRRVRRDTAAESEAARVATPVDGDDEAAKLHNEAAKLDEKLHDEAAKLAEKLHDEAAKLAEKLHDAAKPTAKTFSALDELFSNNHLWGERSIKRKSKPRPATPSSPAPVTSSAEIRHRCHDQRCPAVDKKPHKCHDLDCPDRKKPIRGGHRCHDQRCPAAHEHACHDLNCKELVQKKKRATCGGLCHDSRCSDEVKHRCHDHDCDRPSAARAKA